LRGSGRFAGGDAAGQRHAPRGRSRAAPRSFPSLRGSGRFAAQLRKKLEKCQCFNPLHCGAVVASQKEGERHGSCIFVSIPFIAGQWSLPRSVVEAINDLRLFQSPSLRGSGRFPGCAADESMDGRVSIPFIAGQWSLPGACARGPPPPVVFQSPSLRGSGRFGTSPDPDGSGGVFQSPSLRGSGRFFGGGGPRKGAGAGFNPLHCGAVVASRGPRRRRGRKRSVSIPFIAGQWSLHGGQGGTRNGGNCFNPLHCGAVVASRSLRLALAWEARVFQSPSLRGSGRFGWEPRAGEGRAASFNPLHCGAVVASFLLGLIGVSIMPSFNPLHCGAVVASKEVSHDSNREDVSIPFIAGQWSLRDAPPARAQAALVSIPFIAGQWSLQGRSTSDGSMKQEAFQSPSLRGSGRFRGEGPRGRPPRDLFQSPSLRGSGRFSRAPRSGRSVR